MKTDKQTGTITIVKVVALGTETHSVNGLHKTVHCVVKNNPLDLHIKLYGSRSTSFDRVGVTADLFYDTDDPKKVDFVRSKPMQFKTRILQDPSEAVVTCSMKVLSSQHEDMFFRIRLQGLDSNSGLPIAGMDVMSPSVKVISKPEQLNKPKLRQKRKRPLHQEVVDQLLRIEQHQADQREMLQGIVSKLGQMESGSGEAMARVLKELPISNCFQPHVLKSEYPMDDQMSLDDMSSCSSDSDVSPTPFQDPADEMLEHMQAMLRCYRSIPSGERPTKVRRLMSSLSEEDSATFTDFNNSGNAFNNNNQAPLSSSLFLYDFAPASPLPF